MESSGRRPIAFACRQTEVQEIQEDGLHLLGLAYLKYPCLEEIKLVIESFRNADVSIKFVSEDELSELRAIACELGIFSSESDDLAREGEQIRDLSITKRMQKVDRVTLIETCLAKDKLQLVQSIQQNGHVVAFVERSSSSDTPTLKEVDVGITDATWCTKMARESSDDVIWTKGESPLITLQLIWVNWITCILGGLMMLMELQVQELITTPPAGKTSSLLNKITWKTIVVQVLCQASVLLIFHFKDQIIPSMNQDVRKAMIYSGFTLSQVFNVFYVMNLVKKEVLLSVLRNIWFLSALVTVIVMQVLVAEYLKNLADCVKLNWMQ
ncbi:hypothetical protein ACOSQ4_003046 [Xanthoceras sorbifolium]